MLFALSKVLWLALTPGHVILLLVVLGLFWRRALQLGVAAILCVAIVPLGEWLATPLEGWHPKPSAPHHVDGIVILGGALDPRVSLAWGEPAINDAAERLTEAVALARRYPQAKLLFSGGESSLRPIGHSEAEATVAFFESLGIGRDRLIIEPKARNTWENALFSQHLAGPRDDETWLLVTSAWHMPRALGCFRRIGWNMLPWPVDFRTDPSRVRLNFAFAEQLSFLNLIAKEWVGLAAYAAMGRI